ncbi:hypothetical protein GOV04_03585 [Candidatus Woesearchaeota archaeon]|nr:hypothetical protein [Candidatus Woesearchaeota archaeon]
MKKLLVLLLLVCFFAFDVFAIHNTIPLLAVSQQNGNLSGSVASLTLEVVPGSGRVFIDTFPLSKIDTQITTRFAKEIACELTSKNCDRLDFIYTLRANSAIVGGPSAGAATTVLTTALLEDLVVSHDVAITGTINSGGLIGVVSGLEEKIDAAANAGLKVVLVPTTTVKKIDNSTVDLVAYGILQGVKVIKVETIEEALYYITGKNFSKSVNVTVSERYNTIMKGLAGQLCNRTKLLLIENVENLTGNDTNNTNIIVVESAKELYDKGVVQYELNNFYSSASFCFGANTRFAQVNISLQNFSVEQKNEYVNELHDKIKFFNDQISNRPIETIADLQAFMITKERLLQAESTLKDEFDSEIVNPINLAYATERYYSALSWSSFFGSGHQKINIDPVSLELSCRNKIGEAEQRLQYLQLLLPNMLQSTRDEIDYAYADLRRDDFALCLFKASKAKAEVDVVLGSQGNVSELAKRKIAAAAKVIAREQEKGLFPIVGFSYFEYANTLVDTDPSSALLYAEYSLELSDMSHYFKKRNSTLTRIVDVELLKVFVAGLFFGALFMLIIRKSKNVSSSKKLSKKRK